VALDFAASLQGRTNRKRGQWDLWNALIWRKLWFGTPSQGGSRFVKTIWTVIESGRRQTQATLTLSSKHAMPKNPHPRYKA
jgi:hypothetical protein